MISRVRIQCGVSVYLKWNTELSFSNELSSGTTMRNRAGFSASTSMATSSQQSAWIWKKQNNNWSMILEMEGTRNKFLHRAPWMMSNREHFVSEHSWSLTNSGSGMTSCGMNPKINELKLKSEAVSFLFMLILLLLTRRWLDWKLSFLKFRDPFLKNQDPPRARRASGSSEWPDSLDLISVHSILQASNEI